MTLYGKSDFLPYLAEVGECNQKLSALNDQWNLIHLLLEMNCPVQSIHILPSMVKIQEQFFSLQKELVDSLVTEALRNLEQKAIPRAQTAVDILIRNLYERTADVGFLATDPEIRRFVSLETRTERDREAVLNRIRSYAAKYTVYNEIIILDRDFRVLANLDPSNAVTGRIIDDPLLAETRDTEAAFVETYRSSPLQTARERAHIFSCKISSEKGGFLGVVCLCFRFQNEMREIFRKLSPENDGFLICLIDDENRVIASSDSLHLPYGTTVEAVAESGKNEVFCFDGLEYLAKTLRAHGYEGYSGLGWRGHVMVPLGLAFREKAASTLGGIDPKLMEGLMGQSDSFSPELNAIIEKTKRINRSLKSIVFNGQIITGEESRNEELARLRPLLSYISRMGGEISRIFADSVRSLFEAIISTRLRQAGFLASLCVDIMDRNLYERSDDCRWWALNPTFRRILANGRITQEDAEKLTAVLTRINGLYTVYSSLFLFDRAGKIVAVSNPDFSGEIGTQAEGPFFEQILKNTEESEYFTSPFERSRYYNEKPTYLFGASVTDPQSGANIGGIAIVFDSEPQFGRMLSEAVPSGEAGFAVFADRQGNVVSSSLEGLPAGSKLEIPGRFLKTENGRTRSEILVYRGQYYAVGCACSGGYREYKKTDGHRNDVLSLVFERLASYRQGAAENGKAQAVDQSSVVLSEKAEHCKLVSFVAGGRLVALREEDVVESIDSGSLISIPESSDFIRGAIVYHRKYVPVLDTRKMFGSSQEKEAPHMLIVRLGDGILAALEAEELNNVLEVNESDIKEVHSMGGEESIVKGVICFENAGKQLMLVLNPGTLLDRMDPALLKADLDNVIPLVERMGPATPKV